MPRIASSVPQSHPVAPVTAAPATTSPAETPNPGPAAEPPEAPAAADQTNVAQRPSFAFDNAPVSFPEPQSRPQELPGFGEVLGGLAAFMVPGGAPSASFTPLIQQAEKNLQARRAPKPAEPIDTAASDTQMQKP